MSSFIGANTTFFFFFSLSPRDVLIFPSVFSYFSTLSKVTGGKSGELNLLQQGAVSPRSVLHTLFFFFSSSSSVCVFRMEPFSSALAETEKRTLTFKAPFKRRTSREKGKRGRGIVTSGNVILCFGFVPKKPKHKFRSKNYLTDMSFFCFFYS